MTVFRGYLQGLIRGNGKNEVIKVDTSPITTLNDLAPGSSAIVACLQATGFVRRRLLDIGLVPGTRVEVIRRSPGGDPTAYKIRGTTFALRREEGVQVLVRKV